MNVVEVTGRLTRDPELRRFGASNFPIATLNLGVENGEGRWNRDTQVSEVESGFYKVEVKGQLAEQVAADARKGDELYVKGSLSQFTAGKDEARETKTQIAAKVVMVLSRSYRASLPEDPPPPEEINPDEEPF